MLKGLVMPEPSHFTAGTKGEMINERRKGKILYHYTDILPQ